MKYQGIDAHRFKFTGQLHSELGIIFPSRPELDGQRNGYGLADFADNTDRKGWIFQNCCAAVLTANTTVGASEISGDPAGG